MVKFSDVIAALGNIEGNGEELKSFIKQFVSEKDKAIADAESGKNTSDTRLQAIAKDLGVNEADIEEALKTAKGARTELDTTKKQLEATNSELTSFKTKVSDLERREFVGQYAALVGADKDVLIDLLPSDVELKIEDGDQGKKAVVISGGNSSEFADFVDKHEKLSKYKNSIFTQEQNPPQLPPKLPSGRGKDTQQSDAAALTNKVKERQKNTADKIRERLSR